MVLSQDKNFIDKLFVPEAEFIGSLSKTPGVSEGIAKEKDEKYLACLIDFIDPYTPDASNIQTLLKKAI